jgi:branched-chain amino acid transport system substrate-binding protein
MNKTRLKVFALIVCIIFSVGVLSACQGPSTTESKTPPPSNTTAPSPGTKKTDPEPTLGRQTLKIAIATCFTGAGARGAETQLYGLQVALNQIEKSGYSKYYDFDLIQADDQYDATQATNVANKLVYQDKVKAVFGHLNAVVTLAGLNVYEEAGVPCLTPSGSSNKITGSGFEYVLLVVPSDVIIAKTLVDYLVKDQGIEKIGVLYANNDQGQSGLAYVKQAMQDLGKTITDEQAYLVADTDFTGQMLNFKAKECEAVVIWGGEVSQRAVIVKQARQYIGTDVQIAGDANFSNATFVSLTEPEDRAGIVFAAAWSNQLTDSASKQFIEDFTALDPMKQTPGAVTVRFYDGMYLLATALNNMGPYDVEAADFSEKLNNALHEATYEGLQGLLDPDPAGNCLNKSMIIRYDESGNEELVK